MADSSARLCLLGTLEFSWGGKPAVVPRSSQRLLALLALDLSHPLRRTYVAGTLWPEASELAARSNLRSALSRLGVLRWRIIETSADTLRLKPGIAVDLHENRDRARMLLGSSCDGAYPSPSVFASDLLPDWDDVWVEPERESYRQLRLHALEALSSRLVTAGRFSDAVEAALMAVSAAPLRESAHRALIRAHAAEGNQGEALCSYRRLCQQLEQELGVKPSFGLGDVLTELAGRR